MKEMKIDGFSTGGYILYFNIYSLNNLPNRETSEEISHLFLNNYPRMYPKKLRKFDFERYNSPEKIQQQVKEGNFFLTVTINNKIVGMTKYRKERRMEMSADCEEWLGAWIMIDKPYRGLGMAEKLFEKNLEILLKMRKASKKRIFFMADVHKDNTASIHLCEQKGFSSGIGKSSKYLLFRKEIVG